jgi:thiamine-phosphate pyrophosphorylase
MLRYAITDRSGNTGSPAQKLDAVVLDAGRWAAAGIDFIQIREKDLAAGELAELTRRVMETVRAAGGATRVLVNSRADVAAAAGADGVHLTSGEGELTPQQVRKVFLAAGRGLPVVSISCHRLDEVRRANALGADAILFGPVFGKTVDGMEVTAGVGMEALRQACRVSGGTRVFALGGITPERVAECVAVGAAGVAGIRLYHAE